MKINFNDFFQITGGKYNIGLNNDIISENYYKIKNLHLKNFFLINSCPEQEVVINKFYISKKLVTLSEFENYVNETGYKTEAERDGWGWVWEDGWLKKEDVCWRSPFGNNCDIRYNELKSIIPALQISWNDSMAYCRWFKEKSGMNITIPGEFEWEIFSRETGGLSIIDYFADLKCKNEINDFSIENFFEAARNGFNFFQTGILWEWTRDWFAAYPQGMTNKEFGETYKVLRGGSYMSHLLQKTCEYRFRRCPTARSPFYGLRIAVYN